MSADPTSGDGPNAGGEDFDGDFLSHFYKAGELMQIDKLEEAENQLEKALEMKPGNSKCLNLLGLVCFKLGRFQRSILIYRDLIDRYQDDATLRVNLALVYLKDGQLDEAEAELGAAIELKPDHEKAHRTLALVLGKKGEKEQALEHLAQAPIQPPSTEPEPEPAAQSAASSAVPPSGAVPQVGEPEPEMPVEPEIPIEPTTPFSLEADCLVADSPGRLYSRLSTLTWVRGDLKFTAVKKRFEREATKYPFGSGMQAMVQVEGAGQLHYSAHENGYHLHAQSEESGYFLEEYLFAFSEVAFWENGRLPSEEKNDPPVFHLRGPAQLVLTCPGKLHTRKVEEEGKLLLDLEKLVGWSGNLTPRVVKISRPLPKALWIELSGTGEVFHLA